MFKSRQNNSITNPLQQCYIADCTYACYYIVKYHTNVNVLMKLSSLIIIPFYKKNTAGSRHLLMSSGDGTGTRQSGVRTRQWHKFFVAIIFTAETD